LISVETIAAILTNITDHLQKYHVPLFLADFSPLDVYKRQSFLLSRQDSTLTITLQFPLAITRSKLTIYRTFSLLMQVDGNNQHAQFIQSIPKFLHTVRMSLGFWNLTTFRIWSKTFMTLQATQQLCIISPCQRVRWH
jgi:hypothetical protein